MNKTTPKKIMEIIYIFILPLLFILPNFSFIKTKSGESTVITQRYEIVYAAEEFVYPDNPIRVIFHYISEALHIDVEVYTFYIIIDYITLWFVMFITWHLLYLFFDTIMHKVLLRKE